MEVVGNWWNDRSIDLVKVGDEVYALNGWNGEVYLRCWKCSGEHWMEASKEEYVLKPVYRCDADGVDPYSVEEGSDEWDAMFEVVDYTVL